MLIVDTPRDEESKEGTFTREGIAKLLSPRNQYDKMSQNLSSMKEKMSAIVLSNEDEPENEEEKLLELALYER
jgi:hypothetical protein